MKILAEEVRELDLIDDKERNLTFSVLSIADYSKSGFITIAGIDVNGIGRSVFLSPKSLVTVQRMFP